MGTREPSIAVRSRSETKTSTRSGRRGAQSISSPTGLIAFGRDVSDGLNHCQLSNKEFCFLAIERFLICPKLKPVKCRLTCPRLTWSNFVSLVSTSFHHKQLKNRSSSLSTQNGADAFISKPCKMPELISTIRGLISSRTKRL